MLESPRGLRAIVLAAIVLCIVASLTGAKAADDKTGLRVAIIDMQKLQAEYSPIKSFKEVTDKQGKDLQVEFETLSRHALLSEADQKALVELTIKEKNTPGGLNKGDADKKKTLETQSGALREDYQKLVQTPVGAVKPEDDTKLKDYLKRINDSETRVKLHQTQLTGEADTKAKDLEQVYNDKLQKALSDVAKKNGCNLILSKGVAIYADYDCTKDVLNLMNK